MAQHLALPAPVARHPFRQQLAQGQPRKPARPHNDDQDLRLFALSFTAFFICIYTFIF
ncbi:hypothetical protein NDN01_03805 [Sphingomonas sp. QA11]|uniref:hypothetical protein n=1 Tax=Sphingomonas sp. QA11 TaxID=2950605 RepID=UPI00234AED1E|nr:hypothetical protein [Sphingomonas sp. QA11]WCM28063.1 hypothetical protein NDN01_03805 [Sphingomonas sp. QA11]